jgi:hypothetical protein
MGVKHAQLSGAMQGDLPHASAMSSCDDRSPQSKLTRHCPLHVRAQALSGEAVARYETPAGLVIAGVCLIATARA